MRRTKANSLSRTRGGGFGSNRHTTAAGTTNHRLSCKKHAAASKHFCKCHNHNSRQLSHRVSLHQTNATVIGLRTCLANEMPYDGNANAGQWMHTRETAVPMPRLATNARSSQRGGGTGRVGSGLAVQPSVDGPLGSAWCPGRNIPKCAAASRQTGGSQGGRIGRGTRGTPRRPHEWQGGSTGGRAIGGCHMGSGSNNSGHVSVAPSQMQPSCAKASPPTVGAVSDNAKAPPARTAATALLRRRAGSSHSTVVKKAARTTAIESSTNIFFLLTGAYAQIKR